MSELATALDLIYEDDDLAEPGLLGGQEVRLRVRSNTAEVSPLAAQFQGDGPIVRVRRSEVPVKPARGSELERVDTGERYLVQTARPFGRFEWGLDLVPADEP